MSDIIEIKDNEFMVVQKLLFEECGINLNDSKKAMVSARLQKRISHYKLKSYADYLKIVHISAEEKNEFLNALSTNETYFFREEHHFNFLSELVKEKDNLTIWSAASSMGAEAYSISFILDYYLGVSSWKVYGSDINTEVLKLANKGLYPLSWSNKIPQPYRSKYCLKGNNKYANKMLVDMRLRDNIEFFRHNLLDVTIDIEECDVIFLRNVLLYFDEDTKNKVIKNVIQKLKIGGYFIISLTEHFNEKEFPELQFIKHNIYQKVAL